MVWLLTAQLFQRFVQVNHLNKFTPRIGIRIEQGIEQGIEKGREEGIDQGKLVGQVQLLESLCHSIPTMEAQLRSMSVDQLKSRLTELRHIFDARQS